jgi:hypothetical protein
MKLEYSGEIFEKYVTKYQLSWIYTQWDSSCYMRIVRKTDGRKDRQTDTVNLTVAFRNFTIVPKNIFSRMEHVGDYIVEIHFLKSYWLQVNLKLSFSITDINNNPITSTGYRDKTLHRFVVLFCFHFKDTIYESQFYFKRASTPFAPALSLHYELLQVL